MRKGFRLVLPLACVVLSAMLLLETGCGVPEEMVGVRFKSFANTGSREIYVGIPDLGVGNRRAEVDHVWTNPGLTDVSFTYDKANDRLVAWAGNTSVVYPDLSSKIEQLLPGTTCTLDKMNSFRIHLVDRQPTGQTDFLDVEIDGIALPPTSSYVGDGTWRTYRFLGFSLQDGFTLTGKINLSGTFTGDELNKVEVTVGCWLWP